MTLKIKDKLTPTRQKILSMFEDALFLEPAEQFDMAIIGISERAGGMMAVAYDRSLVIDALIIDGMTRDDAEEFFEYNTIGSWMGEHTPVFVDTRWAE